MHKSNPIMSSALTSVGLSFPFVSKSSEALGIVFEGLSYLASGDTSTASGTGFSFEGGVSVLPLSFSVTGFSFGLSLNKDRT